MSLKNFSYVIPGVLAGCAAPTEEQFRDIIQSNADSGNSPQFRTVIDLREQSYEPPVLALLSSQSTLRTIHIPLADFEAPPEELMSTVSDIVRDPANQPVIIHCRAGIGRTGVMLAAAVIGLCETNESVRQAVGSVAPDENGSCVVPFVKQFRKGSLEVPVQLKAVLEYEAKFFRRQ